MFDVERCAEFVEGLRDAPLAAEVLHHAKRAVIDWRLWRLEGEADVRLASAAP